MSEQEREAFDQQFREQAWGMDVQESVALEIWKAASNWRAGSAQGGEGVEPADYPDCDTCGKPMDYMPWHYSRGDQRHLHACEECWPKVDPAQGNEGVEPVEGGEPLPCPFCGEAPHRMPHPDPTYPQIQCRNIECPIGITAEEVSLESWNYRAHPQPAHQCVPECPYTCGWQALNKIIIENAAYFARATLEDEVPEPVRQSGIAGNRYAIELCRFAMRLATPQPEGDGWKPYYESPEIGKPVLGYHPDWVDDDFCEDGVRECFTFGDGEEWQSARWDGYSDQWITEDGAPTLWQKHPQPPKEGA